MISLSCNWSLVTSVSDESVIMNQVQDRDIIEFQLHKGKSNPVIDEIDNSPIHNLGTITLHAVEQKRVIEREYSLYINSQSVLYDQLKAKFLNSLEHAINIMEEICPSDLEDESDSAEFVDIEN